MNVSYSRFASLTQLTISTDFGFLDGISQPALIGFQPPLPGQTVVPPGVIIAGADGDNDAGGNPRSRPDWVKDGSFLAFRQLKQLVPEFNKFLVDNPLDVPGLTPAQGSELLGARMIGRWKSVCRFLPIQEVYSFWVRVLPSILRLFTMILL